MDNVSGQHPVDIWEGQRMRVKFWIMYDMSHFLVLCFVTFIITYTKMLRLIIKCKILVLTKHWNIHSWNSKQIKKRWQLALYRNTSEISWLWAVSSGKKVDYWNVYKFFFSCSVKTWFIMWNILQCLFWFFLICLTCLQVSMLSMWREENKAHCNNMTQDFECFCATHF